MPPKSKKQASLFRSVASGKTKLPGLSKVEAAEYVKGVPTKDLPEKVGKPKRFSKLKDKMKGTK